MTRPLNRRMITLSIMMATVMQTLDSTIANVALPHMQGTLSASQDQIAWVLTAYIVAAAIATPLTGWVVDRFGQKNVFMASVIGFTAASALWGMGVMVGPILGPTLGGWLTDSYSWRWVFFINVPVGALAGYGIWRYMRPVPAARRVQFDIFGF